MALFVVERNFAEQLQLDDEGKGKIAQVTEELGGQWLFSFLSADKKKTYCLVEAPNPDAVREASRQLGLPADVVVELSGEVRPPGAPVTR